MKNQKSEFEIDRKNLEFEINKIKKRIIICIRSLNQPLRDII